MCETWMDLENIMLNEMSDTEGQILYDSSYMRYLEKQIQRDRK